MLVHQRVDVHWITNQPIFSFPPCPGKWSNCQAQQCLSVITYHCDTRVVLSNLLRNQWPSTSGKENDIHWGRGIWPRRDVFQVSNEQVDWFTLDFALFTSTILAEVVDGPRVTEKVKIYHGTFELSWIMNCHIVPRTCMLHVMLHEMLQQMCMTIVAVSPTT